MPCTCTYNGKLYSVDLIHAYVNIYKPPIEKIDIDYLIKNLDFPGWDHGTIKGKRISARDVLKYPKKYKKERAQIDDADLKYPIIVTGDIIIDGIHRLTKAHLLGKKHINAYVFSKTELKKFAIKDECMPISKYIEIFVKDIIS